MGGKIPDLSIITSILRYSSVQSCCSINTSSTTTTQQQHTHNNHNNYHNQHNNFEMKVTFDPIPMSYAELYPSLVVTNLIQQRILNIHLNLCHDGTSPVNTMLIIKGHPTMISRIGIH